MLCRLAQVYTRYEVTKYEIPREKVQDVYCNGLKASEYSLYLNKIGNISSREKNVGSCGLCNVELLSRGLQCRTDHSIVRTFSSACPRSQLWVPTRCTLVGGASETSWTTGLLSQRRDQRCSISKRPSHNVPKKRKETCMHNRR
jgi:hypothetical protein